MRSKRWNAYVRAAVQLRAEADAGLARARPAQLSPGTLGRRIKGLVSPPTLTLNVPQTIFTILFAVFAGTAASAQPRWKAFAWAHAFREGPAFWRCVLSVAVLNVLPLLFFSFTIVRLGGDFLQPIHWDARATLQILFAAAPAFSAFAFYRLWIAVVLCSPKTFYRLDAEGKPPPISRWSPTTSIARTCEATSPQASCI